jgi:hypothetical protein
MHSLDSKFARLNANRLEQSLFSATGAMLLRNPHFLIWQWFAADERNRLAQ